jgi:23S rRNA (pseudouridine1915-N3)-methyltransferase
MNFHIIAIGRAKPGPVKDSYNYYKNRLKSSLKLHELEVKRQTKGHLRKSQEATLLSSHVSKNAFTVALDERGAMLSSAAFASQINIWTNRGFKNITFFIGGPDGLDKTIFSRTNSILSFGTMTWPHMLIRVMLVEQLYRAQCIKMGHPYHRSE